MKKIPLFDLNYGAEEEAAALTTIQSKWLSQGANTEAFEEKFASMHQSPHAVAVTNCTAALHLALRVCGIGPGDEVIVPSLSFVATASCVKMVGATPVFADIASLDDWTICPKDIEAKITEKTRAIIPMHFGGHGADMVRICEIAKEYDLKVVEDACHAPLGTFNGKMLGTYGDFGCYSFYSNKNMSTGEGGMLLVNDPEYNKQARLLRSHGMTATAYDREKGKEFYDVVDWGYNYRIDDIRAALGVVQLDRLEADIAKRGELVARYRKNLEGCDDVTLAFNNYGGESSNYVMGVLINHGDRAAVRKMMGERGIGTSMHYPPIHQFGCYEKHTTPLPITEEVGRRELSLPLYFAMTLEDVDHVCEQLAEVMSECK